MTSLETTLAQLAALLEAAGTPYMVIGGFANLQWGRPRLTQDLDITVSAEGVGLAELLLQLAPAFHARVSDPVAFAEETALVPLVSANGTAVDMAIARLTLEFEAISRANFISVGGVPVRFATAEDLILHKIISERARDAEDIEGIVARQRGRLDLDYLRPRVGSLARALERPQMLVEFERLVQDAKA
jgi:hypothetical protein